MNDNMQVDVSKVIQKLQSKLAEAMTNSAIMEARVEQLQDRLRELETAEVADDE